MTFDRDFVWLTVSILPGYTWTVLTLVFAFALVRRARAHTVDRRGAILGWVSVGCVVVFTFGQFYWPGPDENEWLRALVYCPPLVIAGIAQALLCFHRGLGWPLRLNAGCSLVCVIWMIELYVGSIGTV